LVLEQIRIHESWLQLAEEHIKWGDYVKAKDLLKEVNLHSRILKDQANYAKSLLSLSTVAYLEGESGSALKLDMLCHNYAQDMEFVEKAIIHTNDLLIEYDKIEDCRVLLDGSINMLLDIKQSLGNQKSISDTKKSISSINPVVQNNLPLEYALSTCYLLKATLNIKEIYHLESIDDQEPIVKASFDYIDKFESQLVQSGCNQAHLIKLLRFSNILQSQITSNMKQVNLRSVEFAKYKLERCAKILLKVQELLTDQMYYIGIHQDSNQSTLSLPLTRLLGVVKVRLAQINTDIGVIKNQIKQGASTGPTGGAQSSVEDKKKLDKVVATFMDAVTKQIEAQANTYNREMNRYEKSITMLQSALNMIHKDCPEHAECLVEIARCKRLLAVNKKHLRGQWRQDAIEVDEVSLNKSLVQEQDGKDRNDMLGERGLDGEVTDLFVDYKEEAIKSFV
jgi:tetratricopeptide (TPR) repeat protein